MTSTQLILGTAQIEPTYGITRARITERENWEAVFFEAQSEGFSAVDTAALYRGAHAALGRSSWKGEIHTKFASLGSLLQDFENAKRDIGRTEIDVVYFHRLPQSEEAALKFRHYAAELKDRGARAIGISLYSPQELETILEIQDVTHVQIPLSALDQRFLGEPMEKLRNNGKKVILRSVFLQGLLATNAPISSLSRMPSGLSSPLARFRAEAVSKNFSFIESALAFIRGVPGIHGVIIGCDSIAQVKEVSSLWKKPQQTSYDWATFAELAVADDDLIDPRRW